MAKLQQFRDFHNDATSKLSENTRTLALSAIAIVWVFKTDIDGHFALPNQLYWPLVLVIAALALDFIQYLYKVFVWKYLFEREEKRLERKEITEDTDLYVDSNWNVVAYGLFYAKLVAVIFAYGNLLVYLSSAIKLI
jgi:hypothetical protein